MCVDYRAINALTVKWKYPILTHALTQLKEPDTFLKKIDQTSIYQVESRKTLKKYTAMLTRWGLWEWNYLSFGLVTPQVTFHD
jgi:hypothetical protein